MGRRGDPRPGARFLLLGPAMCALVLTTACGAPGGTGHHAAPDPPHATPPSPAPTSPAGLCARLVAHWSREVLDGTTYGDYQSMGLSNGEYEILRGVVDAARPVRRRQGTSAADELIVRRASAACDGRYRHGAPSESPWQ
ncbi:hypothetical protein A6P39_030720 [Streptomyces sp. FXJ1.172]|uniref:hypothetical protein n=1 Tax=Streptomyces sp. FXJ1.172 TaxID=710705 RepID=UPI000AD16784|nr:hypothetical protein [Streptomyces sp. FXJ1.172]WEO98048.1 hypothetical protein A6P39_030720 [Streptomyces sp. FXJ1.172]